MRLEVAIVANLLVAEREARIDQAERVRLAEADVESRFANGPYRPIAALGARLVLGPVGRLLLLYRRPDVAELRRRRPPRARRSRDAITQIRAPAVQIARHQRLALAPASRYSAAMDEIVRTITTETTEAIMISITGIMTTKR